MSNPTFPKKTSDDNEQNRISDRRALIMCWVLPPLFAAAYFFGLRHFIAGCSPLGATSSEVRGQFGDSFGALNALAAGYAFAFLLFTIRQQRREIALQKEALEAYRGEVEGQNEHAEISRFESKFFKLLDDLRNLKVTAQKDSTMGRGVPGTLSSLFQERTHPAHGVEEKFRQRKPDEAMTRHREYCKEMRSRGAIQDFTSWLFLTYDFLASAALARGDSQKAATDYSPYFSMLSASLPLSIQSWLAIELLWNAEWRFVKKKLDDIEYPVFTKLNADWRNWLTREQEHGLEAAFFKIPERPISDQ